MSTDLPNSPTTSARNSSSSRSAVAVPSNNNELPELPPAAPIMGRSQSVSRASLRQRSGERANPPSLARSRQYRSQYPLDSSERHVEYILVASFHVDRGPIMEHQYPAPIGGDESMLAELMLPDQTHVRSQDWTIFFLHKDTGTGEEEESQDTNKTKRKRKNMRKEPNGSADEDDGTGQPFANDEETTDDEDVSGEGPPLMYVLNLVNTKQDNTFRRCVFPVPIRYVILT